MSGRDIEIEAVAVCNICRGTKWTIYIDRCKCVDCGSVYYWGLEKDFHAVLREFKI